MPIAFVGYRNMLQHHQLKAPNTINAHIAALHAWCTWLFIKDYTTTNPALRLRMIGQQKSVAPKALKGTQIDALLREAQRSSYPARNYAILQILIQTGVRIGECVGLPVVGG